MESQDERAAVSLHESLIRPYTSTARLHQEVGMLFSQSLQYLGVKPNFDVVESDARCKQVVEFA